MTDVRVVVPSDIGSTIQLGAKEQDKFDVVFPTPEVSVQGDQITVTIDGNASTPAQLPAQKTITKFERQGNNVTIKLGADQEQTITLPEVQHKELTKFERQGNTVTVQLGQDEAKSIELDPAKEITEFSLQEKTLHIRLGQDAEKTVDLTPMLPAVVAEVFLKDVKKVGDELRFTVGEKDNTENDTTLKVNVSDLLPVQVDNVTLAGEGIDGNVLRAKISQEAGNAIEIKDDGLYVAPASAPIRLVNATGKTELGRIFPAGSL